MIRRKVGNLGLALLATVLVSCGGGGGGSTPSGSTGGPSGSANEVTDPTGRLSLAIDDVTVNFNQSTQFTVTLRSLSGLPITGKDVSITAGTALNVNDPVVTTDANGRATGSVTGAFGGRASVRAEAVLTHADDPSIAVELTVATFINVVVVAPAGAPTPTQLPGQPTATPLPASLVRTLVVETIPFAVSSTTGGDIVVKALAFDQDNAPVDDVEILFDFSPKEGLLRPATAVTKEDDDGQHGVATTSIHYDPGVANPGPVNVTAVAGSVTGKGTFNITSGTAQKPVATLLLQASTNSIGTDSGGSTGLIANVFDGDNNPINGINVLFLTPVGQVVPLTAKTQASGSQQGVATTTLTIPAGTQILRNDSGTIIAYQ
ncbi:MAG TPA: hypothetical protein VL403_09620, partial [Candidatus Kryptonia bacterium]|nr:hypothetical protein [Candidatus Kryptonia bacterium]